MVFLLLSMLASVVIWSFLFSFKLAIALILSLFIHEYGHFYWMGREGIKDKEMFFMPPFEAVARAKEPWTSYGAELRIALAGPIAGLLSVFLFLVFWMIYPSEIFLASIALACMINLFNLILPIPILDGGRVIKSILYSINRTLGDMFYVIGFLILGLTFIFGYLSTIFVLLIGYFLYREWDYVRYARKRLEQLKQNALVMNKNNLSDDLFKEFENEFSRLNTMVNMKRMTWKEMALGFLFFVIIIFVYSIIIYWVGDYIEPLQLKKYFQ